MLRGKIPHFRLTCVAQKRRCLSSLIPSFPLTYCQCILFCFHSFSVSFTSFTLGPQPLRYWLHCYLQLSWVMLLHYFSHTNSSCFLLSSRSSHNWSGLFLPSSGYVYSGNITSSRVQLLIHCHDFFNFLYRLSIYQLKSGCQRKPGKMLKMSTEGGQQNKFILTS